MQHASKILFILAVVSVLLGLLQTIYQITQYYGDIAAGGPATPAVLASRLDAALTGTAIGMAFGVVFIVAGIFMLTSNRRSSVAGS